MRIVVALGGNALLRRGQRMTAANQRSNVRVAAQALAPLSREHELVISHGNGPQVGLLALQAASYKEVEPYPLDVLGAESEGMIGYMIEQELGNILPFQQPFATILTMVEVDPKDPAFDNPTKFIGPVYERSEVEPMEREKGWMFKQDGKKWRRVVPSPLPKRIFQIRPIRWLIEKGVIVICAGGGGIPTLYGDDNKLQGAEVVIDKDLASALLAREAEADLYIMATDVDGVQRGWGTPEASLIAKTDYDELSRENFAAGSMGPKVAAACWFAEATGKRAAIGKLSDLGALAEGSAGTQVHPTGVKHTSVFGIPL